MKTLTMIALILYAALGHTEPTNIYGNIYGPYELRVKTKNAHLEPQLGWVKYFIKDNNDSYSVIFENRGSDISCRLTLLTEQQVTFIVPANKRVEVSGFTTLFSHIKCYKLLEV